MGMCAGIFAIGPYSQNVANCLPYPAEFYKDTRPGVTVITYLFGITEGSATSRAFAAAVGITDPWDFNQHSIDKTRVDWNEVHRVLDGLSGGAYTKDLERFRALFDNGFEFHFEPNG